MRVGPEILSYEFIGLKAKITKSTNAACVRLSGKTVDETRNTFTILDAGERKMVTKGQATFNFILHDDTIVEVEGKLLIGRPEDRLKKSIRRLW
jgi:ribonuclease P protein subunit POP4